MKANELMIGDWVLTLEPTHKEKVYAQIWAIEEGQTCILVKKDNCNWFVDIEWIEPISLTTEILKKNGFTYYESNGSFGLLTTMSYGNWDVDVVLFNVIHEYRNNQLHIATLDDSITLLHLMECNHVHEFQHALSLCKIEKEIEL